MSIQQRMYPYFTGFLKGLRGHLTIHILFLFLLTQGILRAQCSGFPATTADGNCNGGSTLASGANINSGSYGYCGTSTTSATFSNINLSGGTIRICGNATIGFSSFNSGVIVVSCGSTLTVNSSLTFNSNSGIVNYGTVVINGSLTFQNSNNYFYNELASSKLTVTGDVNFNTNSSNTGYVKNAGYIKVNGNYNAYDGGYTCFLSGGQMECNRLVYMDHNGNCNGVAGNKFTFGSSSGSCILRYVTSSALYNVFTNDSHWNVYQATGSSVTIDPPCNGHATGWGSAVLTANAPALTVPSGVQSCNTITCLTLAVKLTGFSANTVPAGISLAWATASEEKSDRFVIEKSRDAVNWTELTELKSAGNSSVKKNYSYTDGSPYGGINYYRLKQLDENGTFTYSEIVDASSLKEYVSSSVFPNPTNSTTVNIRILNADRTEITVEVLNVLGETVSSEVIVNPGDPEKSIQKTIGLPEYGQLFFIVLSQNHSILDRHKICVIKN